MASPPNVISGQAIGTSIAVKDSTELAQLSTQGMSVGTSVWSAADASFFTLSVSSASLSSDVVQVFGIDGWRWLKGGGGGGSNAFTDSTPSVFASPVGDDSFPGTEGKPVKTLYRATQIGIALGGANIYFADETAVGGPVTGQGLWVRWDGIVADGWLNAGVSPLRYFGVGAYTTNLAFGTPGCARFVGGGGVDGLSDYYSPSLWLVQGPTQIAFEMHNTQLWIPPSFNVTSPVRLGWDYVRRNSGAREDINITNVARTGSSTVFTVDLSTATQYRIVSASRTSNLVSAIVQLGSNQGVSPWLINGWIRVQTSDSNFPSIDIQVHGQSDPSTSGTPGSTVLVSYTQVGADIGSTPVSGGTICSHGLQVRDRCTTAIAAGFAANVKTYSTLRVTAATVTTVTVQDVWNYGGDYSASGAIGVLAKQERARHQASGCNFYSCNFNGTPAASDNTLYSPTVDQGANDAHPNRFFDCYLPGFSYPHTVDLTHVDQDRTGVAILADPGASIQDGSSVECYRTQSINGGLRWYGAGSPGGTVIVDDWLQDSGGNASASFPVVSLVDGSGFESVFINRAFCSDTTTVSSIYIGPGFDSSRVQVGIVDGIESLTSGATPVQALSLYTGPLNVRRGTYGPSGVPVGAPTPWQQGQRTSWIGGTTQPVVGLQRSLGVTAARYPNLFPPLSGWQSATTFPAGITVTQNGLAPDGSSTALHVANANGFNTSIIIGNYPHAWGGTVDGSKVFLGCWMNFSTGVVPTPNLAVASFGSGTTYTAGFVNQFGGTDNLFLAPNLYGAGWQWVYNYAGIVSHTSGVYALTLNVPPGDTYLYAPTLIQVPPTVPDSDAYEYLGNLRHQPLYLQPGMTGTMESTKLVAHGGLGTAARYTVGVASGNITLGSANGKAVELFDESGNSIGVLPMLSYTVNP